MAAAHEKGKSVGNGAYRKICHRRYQLDQIDKEARIVTQLERHTLGDRPASKGDKSQGLKW